VPLKYHIHTEPAPPRFRPVGKLGIVDWREDCSSCHNCVKRSCIYGFYSDEADTLRNQRGYLDYIFQCKGCLSCVQDCTKGILTRVVNPEYKRLGDEYYTPEIILSTWYQADTGRIPVSGSGYGGPFTGSGFDSMWTDMSEIVRPTRDGIHGREYINTGVDIGGKLDHLSFNDGKLSVKPPPLIVNPMPVIFDVVETHFRRGIVTEAIVKAAAELGLLVVVDDERSLARLVGRQDNVVPLLKNGAATDEKVISAATMAMVPDGDGLVAARAALKEKNPDRIVAVRITASVESAGRARQLVAEGVEVIHLVFDNHGQEKAASKPRHMRDVLREVHGTLTKDGTRDRVTLIASSGIAQAEHVAKAVLCGADLVAIDLPLLVALECRLCGECERGELCPIDLEGIELDYATRRIVNLLGAWHQQLIEVLGAMGIREMRRLRGETGRCMFFEDLEQDTFGRLFGARKKENGDGGK